MGWLFLFYLTQLQLWYGNDVFINLFQTHTNYNKYIILHIKKRTHINKIYKHALSGSEYIPELYPDKGSLLISELQPNYLTNLPTPSHSCSNESPITTIDPTHGPVYRIRSSYNFSLDINNKINNEEEKRLL